MMCSHRSFDCFVHVGRIVADGEDPETAEPYRFTADVTVTCAECDEEFVFLGLPGGVHPNQPTCSFDRTEARMVIAPRSEFKARTQQPAGGA